MLELDNIKLLKLFKDFYSLTGIQICLFDEGFNEVLRYPEKPCEFCALVRENNTINQKCIENDRKAFEKCKSSRLRYTYRCHMDLIETATPLIFEDDIIGYIMIGQIADSNSHFEDISSKIVSDTNAEKLKSLYQDIPHLSETKINAAAHIADACASYLYVYKLVKSRSLSLSQRINSYIRDNIDKNISVDMLCKQFYTSRVELYSLFENFFKMSVATYIKKIKIDHAKKLLTNTTLPINKIAANCGFSDYNYFSKIFKHECGLSAIAYRKEMFYLSQKDKMVSALS